jgi:very-short-patch-repair endonuclease
MQVIDYVKQSLLDIVDQQRGVITRAQAIDAGISRHAIAAHLAAGRWQRLHRGVYVTFSGPIPRDAHLWGAVLRAGDQAVLSHDTAAELWRLSDGSPSAIHVSVPRQAGPVSASGLVVHHSARLPSARHPARLPPQTTLEDTVLDLAARADTAEAAVAWPIAACQRRLTTAARIVSALDERGRIRWRRDLTEAVTEARAGVHSPLELRYLRQVERKHRLPGGIRQAPVLQGARRQYLDVWYADYGVIVELDGLAAHPARSRQDDARRDNAHALAGRQTLRYGWVPVAYHSCAVALEVATLLAQRGWRGRPRPCGDACPLTTLKPEPVTAGQPFSANANHRLPSR